MQKNNLLLYAFLVLCVIFGIILTLKYQEFGFVGTLMWLLPIFAIALFIQFFHKPKKSDVDMIAVDRK